MEKTLIDPLVHNGELTPHAGLILGHLLGSWISFRESHNLTSKKVQCCDITEKLFHALKSYEALMRGD